MVERKGGLNMANHSNGGPRQPMPFQGGRNVPIIGQPFEVTGMLITVVVVCKCELQRSLLVTSNAVTECPGCHKGYVVQQIDWTAGQPPAIRLGIVQQQQPDPELVPVQ